MKKKEKGKHTPSMRPRFPSSECPARPLCSSVFPVLGGGGGGAARLMQSPGGALQPPRGMWKRSRGAAEVSVTP